MKKTKGESGDGLQKEEAEEGKIVERGRSIGARAYGISRQEGGKPIRGFVLTEQKVSEMKSQTTLKHLKKGIDAQTIARETRQAPRIRTRMKETWEGMKVCQSIHVVIFLQPCTKQENKRTREERNKSKTRDREKRQTINNARSSSIMA